MAKILLVDDDNELTAIVSETLSKDGHKAEVCRTKFEAVETLADSSFDLLVLDVGLPDGSGFDICRDYRARGGSSPIIMLTGKSDIRDKEQGLDLGADDYVTKPFSVRELQARIRAVLRRPTHYTGTYIESSNIRLDTSNRQAYKNDVFIRLQPLDYSLLEYLMKNPNQVLTQENILSRVWESYTESGVEALRAAVKRIRKEIDDEGQDSYIETIYKVGYAFRPAKKDEQ
jgi:DNA-binding response OmpR family regulator